MPSLLIIEDGSGVSGANSYASAAQARSFASLRGITLSATDSVVEILLIKGSDYLQAQEGRFKGKRVAASQALAWPRSNVYLFDSCVPLVISPQVLPQQLLDAQCQLAIEALTNDLQATGTGQETLSKQVETLSIKYSRVGIGTIQAQFNKVEAILEPLVANAGAVTQILRV